jgi:hypothetical protein
MLCYLAPFMASFVGAKWHTFYLEKWEGPQKLGDLHVLPWKEDTKITKILQALPIFCNEGHAIWFL